MDNKNRNGMSMSKVEQLFKHLEARVDEFIELCDEYKRHNRSLQARESQLAEERAAAERLRGEMLALATQNGELRLINDQLQKSGEGARAGGMNGRV